MLNTFFFGYLSLKWKRLFRTLIMVAYFFDILWSIGEAGMDSDYPKFDEFILLISIPIVSIALISWVIKPFIVKEDS